MTIQKAVKLIATDPRARTLNPKTQASLRQIAEWQRRGDYSLRQDQAAETIAFYLTGAETEKVLAWARQIRASA